MATDLRMRMAAKRMTAAEVAALIGRNGASIARYRSGLQKIPLDVARVLYENDLLGAESILGSEDAEGAA